MPANRPEEKFSRTYESLENRSFKYTTSVRHQGVVIAFAMDDQQKIYFSVLNFERGGVSSALDVNYWDNDPLELRFSNELGQVGARAAGLQEMPIILKNGAFLPEGEFVEDDEIDYFLSTTARLSADAPFKVLSDGEYIYLFRQAIAASNIERNIFTDDGIAIVDSTMLVDRFIYRNGQLIAKLEVRFQRSRRIDQPASRKDTLGNTDLENKPFFEPTHELDFIRHLAGGNFAVERIPTAIPKLERWQIFAHNTASQRIDSFSIERASDGLFNTQGTRYYTSPNPLYQNDVFEREPGTDPFTGEALIPKLSNAGFAEFALNFNGVEDDAVIIDFADPAAHALAFPSTTFSFECWIKTATTEGTIISYAQSGTNDVLRITNPGDLNVVIMGNDTGATGISVADGSWHHLGVSWDSADGEISIFVDGRPVTPDGVSPLSRGSSLPGEGVLCFGQQITLDGGAVSKSGAFSGMMDDVRLWSRLRTAGELAEEKNYRLIGNESDLVGYWRFDEGAGNAINDQTDNGYHGALDGEEPEEEDPGLDTDKLDATALQFDGTVNETHHVYNPFAGFPSEAFTIEFWIKTSPDHQQMVPISYANEDNDDAVYLFFDGDLRVSIYGQYSGPSEADAQIRDNAWHHCAVTWANETGELRLYIDGHDETPSSWADIQLDHIIRDGGSLVLGQEQESDGSYDQPFHGELNEVRIWSRVRSHAEIIADKDVRIDPFHSDLVFCVHTGSATRWVFSDAPIGDHPGVRRSSFAINERRIGAGMATKIYYQQEKMTSGYNPDSAKPMKRNARIMLAVSTLPTANDGTEDYVAALDFGLTKEGKLAQVPDLIELEIIDRPGGSQGGESLDILLAQIRQLKEEQGFHIAQIESTLTDLEYDGISYGDQAEIESAITQVDQEIDALGGDSSAGQRDDTYQFDAVLGEASSYIFLRGEACHRVNINGEGGLSAAEGYPKPITDIWPNLPAGWTSDFDAAYVFEAEAYEFFKGDEILSYKILTTVDPDSGEETIEHVVIGPQPINERWPELPAEFHTDIDAAARISDNVIGLFKGRSFAAIDFSDPDRTEVAEHTLANSWTELPSSWTAEPDADDESGTLGINAIASGWLRNGPDFLFRNYEYVEYNRSNENETASDPILVDNDAWPNILELLGIDPELEPEELRLQQFYYLKEKLLQLTDNYSDIEQIEANIHSEVHLSMPMVHFDPDGHWTNGALLGFAWTGDAPELFESINGRLNLYFRGKKDQFFVAYFTVVTGRAVYSGTTNRDEDNDPQFISRITGAEGDALSINIEDGSEIDTCSVTITHEHLDIQETWLEVPRAARDFAQALNGLSETYDYQAFAHAYPGYFKPEDGSRLTTITVEGTAGDIQNGTLAGPIAATESSRWFANSPGNAVSLLNTNAYAGAADTQIDKFAAKNDVSMEAWINPVHTSDAVARVVSHHSANSSYAMGLLKVTDSETAKSFDGSTEDAIIIPINNFPSQAVTIEFWAATEEPVGDREGTLFSFASQDAAGVTIHHNQFTLFDHKNFNLAIGTESTGGTNTHALDFDPYQLQGLYDNFHPWHRDFLLKHWNTSVGVSQWHHYAITWQSEQDEETETGENGLVQIFKDGELVYTGLLAANQTLPANGYLVFGQEQDVPAGGFNAKQALKGKMDEFRLWSIVRTQDELKANMDNALSGNEANLAGYWRLEGNRAVDLTQHGNHGEVRDANNDFSLTASPVQHFVGFAGVGNRYVKTLESLPPNKWQHLAAVYNQSYALDFDGINDRVDCGSDITLDLNADLTVEAIITLADRTEERGIITRGQLADGTDNHVPFALSINKSGRLVFAFEDESGVVKEIEGPEKSWRLEWQIFWAGFAYRLPNFVEQPVPLINPGQTYRIAVTREKKRDTQTRKDSDGNITSVKPREWWDINFYIDGQPAGYVRYEGTVGSSNNAVEIGRAYDLQKQEFAYFKGQISEVRLWNQVRDGGWIRAQDGSETDGTDAGQEIRGNEKGLVSWWRFEENEGNIAFDSKSTNHGTRKGPKWIKNPDPIASKIYMYINGESSGTEDFGALATGDAQFTIGASRDGGARDQFIGWMDEVRIWRSARTQEQVQDNLFRRLVGERDQLIAHYDSDDPEATQLHDQSGRGLHLDLTNAEFLLSSAPISEETAAVRNALASIKNAFHDQTQSRPGVQEYGDVQYDVDGNMIGVMKRCYSYIKDDEWQLVTGFKVGDLELEWIGQAQYDPQLIGFIEGSPPVPSENLTVRRPDIRQTYEKASTVEFKQAESTVQSYSIATDRGIDTSISLKAGIGLKSQTFAGIGVATSVEEAKSSIGIKGHMETSNSWLSEQMAATGQTTNRLSRLDLQGDWENENAVQYPKMGRRYIPRNVGFALVQSETADVFAMRIKHPDPARRTVIGLRMQPNPDIPKDWNIIIFPLNNRYVKQGTLDGKIGFETDADYPNALTYSPNVSYFKPIEAYALKNRIEREQEELKLIYENYDSSPAGASGIALGAGIGGAVGLRIGGPIGGVAGALAGASVGSAAAGISAAQKRNLPDLSKRNMVNTYVWTADGGLFAETEQSMDVSKEVAGGAFSLSGMAGLYADINTTISKVSVKFELEAMMGGHLNLTNQKSEESTSSFQVAVGLDVERRLHLLSEEQAELVGKDSMYDEDGNPVDAPGKVDAYRFMTFYLQPDKEHFKDFKNKVIDQEWLNSNDANAIALSQAINKENGAPWRILHRVTFVSRVLPEIDAPEATSTDETLKAANIQSNFELIRKIEPYVINKTGSYQEFTDAVRDTVRRHLPELISAEDDIVEYMALYFQVFEE